MSKTRLVKYYEDISVIEVLSDSEGGFAVRVATDPKAQRQFDDISAASSYFDELVFKRLNRTIGATAGRGAP